MKRCVLTIILLSGLAVTGFAVEDARLLRMPDINGDLIAFVYAGDIWSVSAEGGEARRLTSHMGMEIFPRISPDGRWIAFSGEYSGSRQIFVIPAEGGTPRQLTFYNDVGMMPPRGGWDNYPLDWTPDSRQVLFRANRTPYGRRMGKYFLVGLDGGLETPLRIPEAGGGGFSPTGEKICYTPISREFRTWKRYKGGRAQDIWTYDLKANTSKRLTTFAGTDQHPIWYGDKIYFVSDRDLTLNIFSYDLKSEAVEKITEHGEFDVLWPSGAGGRIVYENGGFIHKLDLNTGRTEKVTVALRFDNPNLLPYFKNVKGNINSFEISPTGKRAVFAARGDIFTVPAGEGVTYNLTRTQGVRDMDPAWSPDGRYLAYSSDSTGEYEIYLIDRAENNRVVQLTENSSAWRYPHIWSPDSSRLLYSDRHQLLQILDIETKEIQVVDQARRADITDYNWAPDSKWVVYSKDGKNGHQAIWVYSLAQDKARQLTDDMYEDYRGCFSPCGKYIYFISDRDFNLGFSGMEFDYVYQRPARIHAVPLTGSAPALFPDKNELEEVKQEKPAGAKKPAEKKPAATEESKNTEVEIDFEGINQRIIAFPMPAADLNFLLPVEGGVLFGRNGGLHKYTIADKKDELILAGIQGGAVSADGKKFLYLSQGRYGIVDIQPGKKIGDGELDLEALEMKIDPRAEWRQIFKDGWRIYRDWFYVGGMHEVDWVGMREKYQRLVPHVGHRADLDYIFGELVGEINVGHAYVNWGDFPRVDRVDIGLLGCEFEADEKAGRYRIAKIYEGENWHDSTRSPLTEQGIGVKTGDYLISLNGQDVTLAHNPYQFLENTAGKRIPIRVNRAPAAEGAREFTVKPVASELQLFYLDWVRSRREMVDRLSGGRIGYFHVPNTSTEGNRELFKGFYAFRHKDGLIIDERYNGGGFIPDVMIGLLQRRTLNYIARDDTEMTATPGMAHDGPKAMLINHYSASGGDAFPYYFRKTGLGTLIGTTTWGGLVGMSGNAGLVDGGYIAVPTFGFVSTEGEWAVEGLGVAPDIEIWDRPEQVAAGQDPCVEEAVKVLLKELAENPPRKVKKPAPADRSGWHEKKKKK